MSKQIKGDGSNGDVICPPSIPEVQISGETVKIGFTAAKDSGGKILGSWQISTGTLGNKKGTIVGGEVGAGQYKLKGTEDIDEMCKVHDTPTTVTISGQCGQGVTIQVQAASGEKASFFAGLVTCG